MKPKLTDNIQAQMLVGDGALATWLYQHGVPVGTCYEELCLSRPELIQRVHRQYYEAGARILETNTFGANREALNRYGLSHQVERINRQAVALVQAEAREDAYVLGSMTSISGGRWSELSPGQAADLFVEQASALLSGGVDGLILETFLDLEELLLALSALRSLTDRCIIAQLACQEVGRTRDGYSLTTAFQQIHQAGADILGLNCHLGPAEMLRSLEQTVFPEGALLSVYPNAGRLEVTDGAYGYTSSPEYFAQRALDFYQQGVRIVGGCCGTTPKHIQAVAQALQGLAPVTRVNPSVSLEGIQKHAEKKDPVDQLVPLDPLLSGQKAQSPAAKELSLLDRVQKETVVLVEWDPPKDLAVEDYLRGAQGLQAAGADFLTLADNSLAQIRMSNLALGALIKQQLQIEPILHLTCRDRNLIGQQSHLMGLHALGIQHVLVVTGDPASFGDLPGASSVFDVSSFDLIRLIKQMNKGIAFSGKPLEQKGNFLVGAAFNPHVNRWENALRRLERKIEAGADYILTQPMYDLQTIERVYTATQGLGVPVFAGIMPLTSTRNAEYLHNEVPGIKLSDSARQRMRKFTGAAARQEGLEMAKELVAHTLTYFRGIYFITPFNYADMTAELTRFTKHLEN